MLNFLLKTRQNDCAAYTRVSNGTENTYAYNYLRERLPGMLLTANGDNIMETQKQSAIDSPFSACGEYIEWGNDMRRKKSMRRSLRPIYKTSRTEKTVRDVCLQRRWCAKGETNVRSSTANQQGHRYQVDCLLQVNWWCMAIKLIGSCKLTDGTWPLN